MLPYPDNSAIKLPTLFCLRVLSVILTSKKSWLKRKKGVHNISKSRGHVYHDIIYLPITLSNKKSKLDVWIHSRPVLTEWVQNSLRHFMFTRDFRGVYALGVDWNWNNYMRLSLHKAKPQRASPGVNNTSHVRLSRWPWLRPCYYQPGLKRKKLDPLNIFSRCCLVW